MIKRSIPWTTQPPIGVGPNKKWIDRGLVALFDCRQARELISGDFATNRTSLIAPSTRGIAADFSGSANQQYAHRRAYAQTGSLTLVEFFDIDTAVTYSAMSAKEGNTLTNQPFEFRLGVSSADTRLSFSRANSTIKTWDAGVGNNQLTVPSLANMIIVSSPDGLVQTKPNVHVNNRRVTTIVGTGTGTGQVTDNSAAVWLGRRYDGVTQLDGRKYYTLLFNVELSDAYKKELYENPWDIYEPQQRNIYVSVAGGGLSANLGQPSETDTVSALTSAKAQSVGLVASTDTAQAITAVKANSIGLITGTESAQSIASAKACATGQVAETDSLFTISSVKSVSAALVTETETAQPLTAIKYATLGQASESDDALALVSSATSNLGLIVETDTVFAITAIKTATLGLPSESDSALSVSTSKMAMLGLVTEIEYPLPLVSSASSAVGQVVETDTAFAVNVAKLADIGYPTETDSAPSMSAAKMVTLGLVTETGYVFALTSADEWPGDTIRLYSPITMTARWQSPISKTIRLNSAI